MKCIKNANDEIRRVRDDQAVAYVKSGDWEYISKSEWKAARIAIAEKKVATKEAVKKVVNDLKGQKKKKRQLKHRPRRVEKVK